LSNLLEKSFGSVVHRITETFVESFVKRANQIYG